jgi:hypothetical protein
VTHLYEKREIQRARLSGSDSTPLKTCLMLTPARAAEGRMMSPSCFLR